MSEIKVGQVWQQENGEVFVVTFIEKHDEDAFGVYTDGYTASFSIRENWASSFIFNKLIAEFDSWQEAVNSKEFKDG